MRVNFVRVNNISTDLQTHANLITAEYASPTATPQRMTLTARHIDALLTLGDSLTKYLDYLAGKFEYAEIFTNGTLLTDSLIAYIKAHRIRLALSMYSYLEDEHDKVTQIPGSWAKTSEAVRKLRDNGITYTVETQQSVREKVYQRS